MLYKSENWTTEDIDNIWKAIVKLNDEKYHLPVYPVDIQIITSQQLIDILADNALPVSYSHWSKGKQTVATEKTYSTGHQGLAYEIVINTNPCIVYLVENNTSALQTLVLAHAGIGHNAVFKNNYRLRTVKADYIIDYMKYARDYINKCEKTYGEEKVSALISQCQVLHDVAGLPQAGTPFFKLEEEVIQDLREYKEKNYNDFITQDLNTKDFTVGTFYEPNLLYAAEKYSDKLAPWQKEIVRILRIEAQYFYPQRRTKVINEGFATFIHNEMMSDLWEQGDISDGAYIDLMILNSNVIATSGGYLNPYALGLKIFQDLKRVCEKPDDEDREIFPDFCGKDWQSVLYYVMEENDDESFIRNYLGPKVCRQLELGSYLVNVDAVAYEWECVGRDPVDDLEIIRRTCANQFRPYIPDIKFGIKGAESKRKDKYFFYYDKQFPAQTENITQLQGALTALFGDVRGIKALTE